MIVDDLFENVAGPERCWPGYRKVGTKPGTGRNAGRRVNDCEKIKESVGQFQIGDPVIITGNVEFQGKTGDVREVGRDGAFVVVDLYNYGPRSFHSTDVSYNDYADSDDEQEYQQGVAEGAHWSDAWEPVEDIKTKTGQAVGMVMRHSSGTYAYYDNRKSNIESGFSSAKQARQAFVELHNARVRSNNPGVAKSLNEFAPQGSGDGNNGDADLYDLIMQTIEQETNMFEVFGQDAVDSTVSDMFTMGHFKDIDVNNDDDIYNAVEMVGEILSQDGIAEGSTLDKIKNTAKKAAVSFATSRANPVAYAIRKGLGQSHDEYKKNVKKGAGVAEASDISGLMTAASMVQDYVITAEVDGKTKQFRVRGMTGPRAAQERFLKHASQARVIDVKPAAEKGVTEADTDKIGGRYDPEEFDQMMLRLKTLAGAGPLKTVWDPVKRVYRNVPINPQDRK
jgi:hypothetical protein